MAPPVVPAFQTIGYNYAAGYIQGDGTNSYVMGCTVARTGVGQYTVNFNVAHPGGTNYSVTAMVHEATGLRDDVIIHVVDGSQVGASFDLMIHEGDNGGAAGPFVDAPFSFQVNHDINVVINIA